MITCPRCGTQNVDTARFCNACGNALTAPKTTEVRKTVTVVFCDVVGSTSVGERTDPEALRRVMTRYFNEIRRVVERHGGVVEKFIGDAVMAVFGVPAVHEDDALRAVRSAAEIRERLAELASSVARERGLAIAWRTGINTGEVVAGDAGAGQTFVTGDAVNVAARLEQAAQPGEVLIGASTYELVRHAIQAERVGPIPVKGKSEPLDAYRLTGIAAADEGRPGRLEAPMVGRERPRRLLAEAYEQVVSDRVCHLFTVLGSAGVGKSRLVREFLADLGERALVLRGRCLSYGEGITYWPIAEIVRHAAGVEESDHEDLMRDKLGALIEADRDRPQAVQRLGDLIGVFEGAAAQDEMFWAVRTMVTSLARRRPVVIVLDDLHWAEPSLLDLVDHLADWISQAPVLLICLGRRELLDARPGWAGGKTYATTVTLEPLSPDESRRLVVGLLGEIDLGGQLTERITDAAEGNPLFVEEMLAMLIDRGQLVASNGGWTAVADLSSVAVPPTIQALLTARIDGLNSGERVVLERASVEGKVFHRGAVAELTPDDVRDQVPARLLALARKELVRPSIDESEEIAGDETFRFRHLLIRDAAYASIPKETRAELHARFADWLSRIAGDRMGEYAEILGFHYELAYRYRAEIGTLDDDTRAVGRRAAELLGASGRRALDRDDVRSARKLLTASAELLSAADPLRSRVRADLAHALQELGDVHAADAMLAETIETADGVGDEAGRAYAEAMRMSTLTALGTSSVAKMVEKGESLTAILERHGDERGIDIATIELAKSHFFAGRVRVAEQLLSERMARRQQAEQTASFAVWLGLWLVTGPTPVPEATERVAQILESPPDLATEAVGAIFLGLLRAFVGRFEEGRELVRRGLAIMDDLGRSSAVETGNFLAAIESLAGNLEETDRLLRLSYDRLTEAGEQGYASTIAGKIAEVSINLGKLEEAERFAALASQITAPDDFDAQARSLRARARLHALRGEFAEATSLAGQAVELVSTTEYLELRGETYADLAEVQLAAGEKAAAIESLREAIQNFEAKGITVAVGLIRARLTEIEAIPR